MVKNYKITPQAISKILLAVIFVLVAMNLFCILSKVAFGFSFHTMDQFYFNSERNVPTMFSFLMLVTCGLLLYFISRLPQEVERRRHPYWKFLSGIFLFIAADELLSIHETLTDNAQSILGASARGYLYFTWIIPYVITFGIVLALLMKFFISLPKSTISHFSVAACTFITGAVGLEMIGGKYIFHAGAGGKEDLSYMLLVTVEEVLEMIGVVIFINGLLKYYLEHVADRSILVSFNITRNQKVKDGKSPIQDSTDIFSVQTQSNPTTPD